MVMRKKAMGKNLTQSIKRSLGRYLAIVAIIALGAAMFVGLLMTKSDMILTGQHYTAQLNMFDLRLISSFGWSPEQVEQIRQLDGVESAEAVIYQDLVVDVSGAEQVYRFYAIPEQLNLVSLRGGRMPQAPDECLADGYFVNEDILGTTVTISEGNSDSALETMRYKTYTVVGYCASPLYFDMNRGTTTIGNGSLAQFVYVPQEAFDVTVIPEIHVTLPGEYALYSEEYNQAMSDLAEILEPKLQPMVDQRREEVLEDAEASYQEGMIAYENGLEQLEQGKLAARRELEAGRQKLVEGQKQIDENEKMLADGELQLQAAKKELAEGEKTLAESKKTLESLKNVLTKDLIDGIDSIQAEIDQRQAKVNGLDAQIQALDQQMADLDAQVGGNIARLGEIDLRILELTNDIVAADTAIAAHEAAKATLDPFNLFQNTELEQKIAALQARRNQDAQELSQLQSQRGALAESINAPLAQYGEISAQRALVKAERDLAYAAVETAKLSLQAAQSTLDGIHAMLATFEEEIAAGESELEAGRRQIAEAESQLAEGKAALETGKADLARGWAEYYAGVARVEEEMAAAEKELQDALKELLDAREQLDALKEGSLFILDRNSNIGYNSLRSASDIVQSVSRVLPAFFLLIAALVCITTMTRMIDEERMEIGTLKALGYSNGQIISKYMVYAGSGALIGCGLGVLLGSGVFPSILWEAYKIMLYMTETIDLQINWVLCGIVVGSYTAVMLGVTWYCCRRTLQEVPAELIRPKSPDPGKKILLEYLPFWKKISFLNKVTLRNMFRYRQRLAMMVVGIGGCTALLLTGFGLRDSIVNIVDFQFENITTYDMMVNFAESRDPGQQEEFLKEVKYDTDHVMFAHQSSVELERDKQVKEIYLIAAGNGLQQFIDLHKGDTAIALPGNGEAVLSVGVATALGIRVGERIQLRDADMRILNVTVSGIYDNHVQNYAIVSPDTIRTQWGEEPEMQMAFVKVKEGLDIYEVSAEIAEKPGVMNVSVSEDLALMVSNLMEALDLVIVVVVVCAGTLAVVVLYNLTNINITERIREIATIKVLGFRAGETGAYVFKENLALTVIGSLLGLGLGYGLLIFVMSQIRIDMVWFSTVILPPSYFWALGLTLFSACAVDFVFYFKLDKINMAEALKSVE